MDISTIGNYYGENLDTSGEYTDSNLYYKMQITPRYWLLNLDTNLYTPLDVYMGQSGNYKPVAAFDCNSSVSECIWTGRMNIRGETIQQRKRKQQVMLLITLHLLNLQVSECHLLRRIFLALLKDYS